MEYAMEFRSVFDCTAKFIADEHEIITKFRPSSALKIYTPLFEARGLLS